MAKRVLYLVRHGQYVSTSMPPDEPDGNLTGVGQQQATLVAMRLSALPIQKIHHSTTLRGTETAEIIAAQLPEAGLHPAPLLRECIPCVPEAFKQHFAHIPANFIQQGANQAEQAFAAYFQPLPAGQETDQHELLVSHGNLISHLICRVLHAPCDSWVLTDISLCGLSEVAIGAQGLMKVLRHNDAGHLPLELRL